MFPTRFAAALFVVACAPALARAVTVDTAAALVKAVRDGAEGDTIELRRHLRTGRDS